VIEEERLVRLDVGADDAQQKIGLAHQRVALEDLRVSAHRLLEAQQRIAPVAGELHVREHHHREPELLAVEECHALADHPELFQPRHPPPGGRSGEPYTLGELGRGEIAMLLQHLEETQVGAVQFR